MDDTQQPTAQSPWHATHLHTIHIDETVVRTTLIEILQCVPPAVASAPYRLVGTAATLLHGIAVPAGDIDLLFKDRQSVDHFHQALSASSSARCQQPPTWLSDANQYFARYAINGAVVELSTVEADVNHEQDWHECVGRGPWEHFAQLDCGAYIVPTVALELRLLTELIRRRSERYQPILDYLHTHQCNVNLVRRGMIAHNVPQALQHEVLVGLESATK